MGRARIEHHEQGFSWGVAVMTAMIEFICIASHQNRSDPSVTLEERAWAYCAAGARDGHKWTRIDPTAIETLRSPAGNGHVHLTSDEGDEKTLAGRPAR
jgi:hypothetical protein